MQRTAGTTSARTSLAPEFVSADEAAALIPDGATVAITGSGGGILEATAVFEAVARRFGARRQPRALTLIHSLGIGHSTGRGLELWASPELVRRVVGGHWSWSPTMQRLAAEGRIEAYALPAGVISLLLREIGAGRPGLFTRTGLHTFVDPRNGGGRFNGPAEDLVELTTLDGVEHLHYRPFPVDVGIIRGTAVDERGNITCAEEPASLDVRAVALAARASGGRVIAQVRERVTRGTLDPRMVDVPGCLVDAVVLAPGQWQTQESSHNPSYAGIRGEPAAAAPAVDLPLPRRLVAGRAAALAKPHERVNVGFGLSADVVSQLQLDGRFADLELLIEQGTIGGIPLPGELFGVSRDFDARLDSPSQFDLFAAGVIDRSFLGMAEVDRHGSVNVSVIGDQLIGPGGFIDISQHARHVVFCGTFTARGLEVALDGDALRVVREGTVRKFVADVRHVTYAGPFAAEEGRAATYVTERAVFELRPEGLELTEIVRGVDLERDVLAHMDFEPLIVEPVVIDARTYGHLLDASAGRGRGATKGERPWA